MVIERAPAFAGEVGAGVGLRLELRLGVAVVRRVVGGWVADVDGIEAQPVAAGRAVGVIHCPHQLPHALGQLVVGDALGHGQL